MIHFVLSESGNVFIKATVIFHIQPKIPGHWEAVHYLGESKLVGKFAIDQIMLQSFDFLYSDNY